ncbi:MAG: 50S ribosomal protein L4 [Chloroflexi bacterium]|nr:50S ribosomal protein L4 [Chloroflexota bacterium]
MAAKDAAPIAPVETDLFGEPGARDELLRRAAVVGAQRRRQSTSSTQTRGEVTASAQKLYRQKGVGRARAGSASAGQRRGGAVTFGPRPRTVRRRLSRRERREALRSLLAQKAQADRVHRVEAWGDSPKTKERAAWLADAGLAGRLLLLDTEPPEALRRSSRNIPGVTVERADAVGFMEIAAADHVVATDAALDVLRGVHSG